MNSERLTNQISPYIKKENDMHYATDDYNYIQDNEASQKNSKFGKL